MAVRSRIVRLRALAAEALTDLFDQSAPFGRLALTQVLMLGGDTLVTISLAGSLFFSISPTEAKSKVLLYLMLTIAPFAEVSTLGPLSGDSTSHGDCFGAREDGHRPVHGSRYSFPLAVP